MSTPNPRQDLINHCTEAASDIYAECTSILSGRAHGADPTASTSLGGCGLALVELLSRQANTVHYLYRSRSEYETSTAADAQEHENELSCRDQPWPRNVKYDLALKRLEDIASIAYSKFYAFVFKDLPVCWRQLYTDTRILKFCLLFINSPYTTCTGQHRSDISPSTGPAVAKPDVLDELIKTLDLALILAGAAGQRRGRRWVDRALELIRLLWLANRESEDKCDALGDRHYRPAKRVKMSSDSSIPPAINAAYLENMTFSTGVPFMPPVAHPIRATKALSIEEFQAYMDRPHDPKLGPEPLIIRDSLNEWPALSTRPWNRPAYLLSQTFDGRRLVPVEIGRSYVDEGWGQKLITFGEFLREYIDPSLRIPQGYASGAINGTPTQDAGVETTVDESKTESPDDQILAPSQSRGQNRDQKEQTQNRDNPNPTKPVAYLAQHQLFTQLPNLRNDIMVPDYCYTAPPPHPSSSSSSSSSDQPEELEEPLLNAWFGPPRTISPHHHDPYHNILAQVVGRKYVRLYSPLETPRLAARGKENGVEMGNTSSLDVGVLEGWDIPPTPAFPSPSPSASSSDSTIRGSGGGEGEEEEEDPAGADIDVAAFKDIPFVDCILEPGDALYIPIGWWHYVRGLSVSFSVSFWWN
jgi:hypothetical protein